jgi:hypothetical protein
MLFGRRGGERRRRAPSARTQRGRLMPVTDYRGHVLHSVQRPVHVDRHFTPAAQVAGGGAVEVVSRSGKPAQAGGTGTGIISNGRCAARRVSTAPAREAAWHVRKGRGLRPPSLRGNESSGWVARTSYAVAEVAKRRLASNNLGNRAPKRATARANGGLARSERRRSHVGGRFERNGVGSSDGIGHHGARIGAGPG